MDKQLQSCAEHYEREIIKLTQSEAECKVQAAGILCSSMEIILLRVVPNSQFMWPSFKSVQRTRLIVTSLKLDVKSLVLDKSVSVYKLRNLTCTKNCSKEFLLSLHNGCIPWVQNVYKEPGWLRHSNKSKIRSKKSVGRLSLHLLPIFECHQIFLQFYTIIGFYRM